MLAKRCIAKMKRQLKALENPLPPAEAESLMVAYSRELVNQIGDEVDRLEEIILKELPEVKHVDLEIL